MKEKKITKTIAITIIIVLVVLSLIIAVRKTLVNARHKPWYDAPAAQPGTCWSDDKGVIRFCVNSNNQCIGVLCIEDTEQDVYIIFNGFDGEMSLYDLDIYNAETGEVAFESDKKFETWRVLFNSDKVCTAIVKSTTYFKEGETFTIRRLD